MVNTRGEAALVRPQLGDVVFPGFVTRDTAWCGPRDVMNDTRWCEHQPSPTTWQGWEDLLQCLHVALPLCWDQGCWWPTVTPPPPWPRLYTRLPHLTSAAAATRWPPASTTSGDLTSPLHRNRQGSYRHNNGHIGHTEFYPWLVQGIWFWAGKRAAFHGVHYHSIHVVR